MFPKKGIPTSTYNSGFLRVSDIHEIYFEECGNPRGFPIVFIHGGPGVGCYEGDKRFFDSSKWRIILFDQRGSNRSRPAGCIEENTTKDLVSDINVLLKSLSIDRAVLFGGSWGVTLSLLYAMAYPEMVAGMVLRGVFFGTSKENDHYLRGGTAMHFPEAWERFSGQVPNEYRSRPALYYYREMLSGSKETRERLAYEWALYEESIVRLTPKPQKELNEEVLGYSYKTHPIIEAHFLINDCFLEEDYIIQNAHLLPAVPISVVQGRYDVVCPPKTACRLMKVLPPGTNFHMVHAGHLASEPETEKMLKQEVEEMFRKITQNR